MHYTASPPHEVLKQQQLTDRRNLGSPLRSALKIRQY